MSLEKAQVIAMVGSKKTTVDVLFNPSEYALESSNQYSWQSMPGLSQPIAQFVTGEATTLSMELFFDTYEQNTDVRSYTLQIAGMLDIDKDLHAPPLCIFKWGSLSFQGVLEKVSQRYTMFNREGKPVRATLNVTFKAVQSMQEQLKHIPRQSADRTKQRTVKQGDQLWQIAAEEYEDPALWRAIAKANDLADPRQLEPGTLLKIPRLYG
ncbi:LysM peptidoglycan-binding domain-containing protein [Paenibacillus septentrionalis]|uniref:LysM peptidoglycan-binding domain-containing protein n=1 Tax=Paenibacillus septentrionalis TaxID=429342 RepID=A0ABW1V6Y8_9BACL